MALHLRRLRFGPVPWSFGFFMRQGSAVGELGRSLRREVASTTAERGLVLTQPCLSRQVFYGSRRLAGGSKPLPRVWSLPNNVVNLGESIWGDASLCC